jgi:hypothetical protein
VYFELLAPLTQIETFAVSLRSTRLRIFGSCIVTVVGASGRVSRTFGSRMAPLMSLRFTGMR